MALAREAFLQSILSQPSAPFREAHVIRVICSELDRGQVPWFQDPIGNIVIGVRSKAEYLRHVRQKTTEPLRVFIAHMDHPGFHGVCWRSPTQLEVKWHGGAPVQLLDGAPVWLADDEGFAAEGHLTEAKLIASGRSIDTAVVEVPAFDRRDGQASEFFGGFRFRASYWQEGELIYTKAADDLVGSFAVTSLALDHFSSKKKSAPPFIGLLTRAEEVGFIGAIAHFELGWLKGAKRQILCVSLETSRQLPGAEIGKGPVVRLGDRFTVFDAGALRVFTGLAAKALPEKHQRRIMDGGTCEATAAVAYGLPSVGISVPLGNYHNQSFEGGPDSAGSMGPAPEFVHLGDVSGLLALCGALVAPKSTWSTPWKPKLDEFKKDLKGYRAHLRQGHYAHPAAKR